MFKTIIGAWGLLLALIPTLSFAADIHSVFTSWSSAFGREKTVKTELWTGSDKECPHKPQGNPDHPERSRPDMEDGL